MSKFKYDAAKAQEIIEKSKSIKLSAEKDDRLTELPVGAPFERAKVRYDILECLATGVHSKCMIEFGGYEYPFRLLGVDELIEIENKAHNEATLSGGLIKSHEKTIEGLLTLEKALTSCPEANDGVMKRPELGRLDVNYFMGLLREYNAFVARCDINLDDLTDEGFEELVDLLTKKQLLARDLPHRQLVKVTNFLLHYVTILTQPEGNTPTQ